MKINSDTNLSAISLNSKTGILHNQTAQHKRGSKEFVEELSAFNVGTEINFIR